MVFTDCLRTLKNMENVTNHDPIAEEIRNFYHTAFLQAKQIIYIWIPSHIGISGYGISSSHIDNDTADTNARGHTNIKSNVSCNTARLR